MQKTFSLNKNKTKKVRPNLCYEKFNLDYFNRYISGVNIAKNKKIVFSCFYFYSPALIESVNCF